MIWTIIFIICVCWMNDPIGLRVSASLRGLALGTAVLTDNIKKAVSTIPAGLKM